MYLTHFGLTHYPFERALEPDELFASSAVCEAQVRLTHLVELRGIGLVTGEVGLGLDHGVPPARRHAAPGAAPAVLRAAVHGLA